jgi:hypothetical protein
VLGVAHEEALDRRRPTLAKGARPGDIEQIACGGRVVTGPEVAFERRLHIFRHHGAAAMEPGGPQAKYVATPTVFHRPIFGELAHELVLCVVGDEGLVDLREDSAGGDVLHPSGVERGGIHADHELQGARVRFAPALGEAARAARDEHR